MTSAVVKEAGKSQLLMGDDKLINCGQVLTNTVVNAESVRVLTLWESIRLG